MKTNKYIFAGALMASTMLAGCSDSFLESTPHTSVTLETYFNTDEHVQEAVVAAYDPLQWPDYFNQYNPINILADVMADNIWVGGADANDNHHWHLMMNYSATSLYVPDALWTVAYSGVKRSNDVLTYIGWAEDITEKNAQYYEAQARVLRVFYYSWLWKLWGNIPYYETNLGSPYIAPQLTANEVYEKLITDLEGVLEFNNLPMRETAANNGRITKAMVYMLYTELVMYQNDQTRYSKALQYMNEIIASGEYDLVSDYATIFTEAGEWSSESIFEINYKDDNAVRDWGNVLAAGGTVLPTLIGPAGNDMGVECWGFCPVRQETYDMFDANDARRATTCWVAAEEGVSYTDVRYQDTGIFLGKYIAQAVNCADALADKRLNYNNNLRIYRYSETLLNAAELILRGAGSGDASSLLNKVRNRAGLGNVEATIDNVIEERNLEFVGEGKRYWDLIRSGKAASVLTPDEYGYRTNSWTESKKYLPIPQTEIDSAQGSLTQNNY